MERRVAEWMVKAACQARRAVRESVAAREAATELVLFRCEEWGSCGLEPVAATETQSLYHVMREDEFGDEIQWAVRYDGDGDCWEAAPDHCCSRSYHGDCYEFSVGSSIRLTPVEGVHGS